MEWGLWASLGKEGLKGSFDIPDELALMHTSFPDPYLL
jgi:hypothetical protein